ncbi:hypothetical protein KAU55_02245, partial [Candidatus Bathyarchaeota archaeon]|nr:hypothetical protein [Candidatus Bathyarchaeota archaeon]
RNTMKERIGSELQYAKANVVHGIGNKESALKCLETCGNKFLQLMIELFRSHSLKYVIVYDFDDKKVLNFVNKKYNINLGFKNSTAIKGITEKGITFIAAPRTQRYIKRLP